MNYNCMLSSLIFIVEFSGLCSKMKIIFLGTASCFPTPSRGVSCTALALDDGQIWLFDCGEGSQIQMQRCKDLRAGRVTKIFITHLHGDHLYGLPGLLCTLGNGGDPQEDRVVDVYGPQGIRKYLLTSLELSRSGFNYKINIHELVPRENQFPSDWEEWNTDLEYSGQNAIRLGEKRHTKIHATQVCDSPSVTSPIDCNGAVDSTGICTGTEQSANGVCSYFWDVLSDSHGDYCVKAAVLQHRVPCFGYVIQEKDKPGALDALKLQQEYRLKPGPQFGELKEGKTIELENGIRIRPEDVLGPPKKGRMIAVLGDTNDSSELLSICERCDVIVHEATMENSLKEKAVEYGHSTPEMAASFALQAQARKLCITHVSPRYRPASNSVDVSSTTGEPTKKKANHEDGVSADLLKNEAEEFLQNANSGIEVIVAEDFMVVPVLRV